MMDYKEKIARELASMDNWRYEDLPKVTQRLFQGKTQEQYLIRADQILNIRQDCEKCGGEGHFYYAEGGHKAECEVCQGTGTGLSLGEVWERYQQGKLVEKENK